MPIPHRPVPQKPSFPQLEEEVLARWRERDVFHESVRRRQGAPRWVFYEGPPTANGRPGSHHVLSRVFKDIYPRFKTMRGHYVERKGGWDCHGLPVEITVEQELGISSKAENDAYRTLDPDYVESVWWALRQIFDRGLLYEGYKVVPYCPRCGTALSSHEVALGYRDVFDPSVYVRFPVKGEDNVSFLAWTTTPWTLLSNAALAVDPDVS